MYQFPCRTLCNKYYVFILQLFIDIKKKIGKEGQEKNAQFKMKKYVMVMRKIKGVIRNFSSIGVNKKQFEDE